MSNTYGTQPGLPTNVLPSLLNTLKPTIRVQVDYYNKKHKRLLEALPNKASIERLVKAQIEIPTADFLAYCLFHLQDEGQIGPYATFEQCADLAMQAG
jgi:hypothetical protein